MSKKGKRVNWQDITIGGKRQTEEIKDKWRTILTSWVQGVARE
jgi:hypothetical protein